jgi:hypothetical protein
VFGYLIWPRLVPKVPSSRRDVIVVCFGNEEPPNLDGTREFAAAHETLVEHIFQHFQQDAGLGAV